MDFAENWSDCMGGIEKSVVTQSLTDLLGVLGEISDAVDASGGKETLEALIAAGVLSAPAEALLTAAVNAAPALGAVALGSWLVSATGCALAAGSSDVWDWITGGNNANPAHPQLCGYAVAAADDANLTCPAGISIAPAPFSPAPITPIGGSSPKIASLSPDSGDASGGTSVVIAGSGFAGATNVSFGAASCANVSVDSDEQISVQSPGGTGTVDVVVTSAAGASPPAQFTYQ
jgi:hypothetical protein